MSPHRLATLLATSTLRAKVGRNGTCECLQFMRGGISVNFRDRFAAHLTNDHVGLEAEVCCTAALAIWPTLHLSSPPP